jgi:hypothetical protein
LGAPAAVGGQRDAPERPARWDGENLKLSKSNLRFLVSLIVMVPLAGCIGGLAKMERVAFVDETVADQALVNIVRPRIFFADGANTDMWDGDKFIGTLGAGKLIQYKAIPGHHVFMVYLQGQWGAARGELKPGKTYYLKVNPGYGRVGLGVAKSNDPRIERWSAKLTPVAIDDSRLKDIPQKFVDKARIALERVNSGSHPSHLIGDEHAI